VPERVKFRWKLSPLEENYTPATTVSSAIYPSLPPGKYTFYVKACNNSGVWNETPAEYSFEIEPAWWQTTMVKLLFAFVVLLLIAFVYRLRRRGRQRFRLEMETLLKAGAEEIKKQKEAMREKDLALTHFEEEKRKSEEKIKNYRDNIQSLVNVGETALSGKRFDEVFMAVYREMKKMMDISLFGVGMLNKENGMLEFRNLMIRNERAPFLKFPADDPERLPVFSLINDEVVFVKDITLEYKKYVSEMKPLPGDIDPRSVMVIPLKVDGTVLGVLAVQSEKPGAYDDYHLGIAKVTAAFLSAFLCRDSKLTK